MGQAAEMYMSGAARSIIRYSMCTALRPTALALVALLLLIFGGDTGLPVRLLALLIVVLLARLLPATALLLTTLALLVLLIALIGHQFTPQFDIRNAAIRLDVP